MHYSRESSVSSICDSVMSQLQLTDQFESSNKSKEREREWDVEEKKNKGKIGIEEKKCESMTK